MSETTQAASNPEKKAAQAPARKANWGRKTLRTEGRKKRALRLKSDTEYRKAYFAAKSKRSTDKKSAFRKKKSGKK